MFTAAAVAVMLEHGAPQGTSGVKFFTPDEKPVIKTDITSRVLYFDPVIKRAYVSYWGKPIVYLCKGAMPTGAEIGVTTRNKEKEEEFVASLGDTLKAAETLFRMCDNDDTSNKWHMANIRYFKEKLRDAGHIHDPMQQLGKDALLGCGRMVVEKTLNKWVQKKLSEVKKYAYLNYREI